MSETDLDRAIRQTELLAATGVILSSLEYLCQPQEFDDQGGLLSWEIGRTKFRSMSRTQSKLIDRAFQTPGVHVLIALRVAAAALTTAPGVHPRVKAAATVYLAASNWALHLRNSYGADGSDQMTIIVYASLAACRIFPNDKQVKEIATMFMAAQSCLSYLAAGAAKIVSPFWRDGSAMTGVFRTRTFGQQHVADVLRRFPLLAKAGGWGVVLGEMLFPLVMIGNKPIARGLLATGTAFHAGNALFMGLNRFMWAFSATYPSVAYHSRSLSPKR